MTAAVHIIRRRRERKARRRSAHARANAGLALAVALVVLLVILPAGVAVGGALVIYQSAIRSLPDPAARAAFDSTGGLVELYDRSGAVLLSARAPGADIADWTPLSSLPDYVAQATLAAEDPDFLTTTRFSPLETFSRLWRSLLTGPLLPDASLTGRLVRNVIAPLPDVITGDAIAREAALVAEINRRYTPTEILEWHLNTNYYGSDAYGIQAAARTYFGKPAAALTLDEAALLAAIPLAPQYNPIDNEIAARSRQADLLRAMRAAGLSTGEQYEQAAVTQTVVQTLDPALHIAPEFAVYARRQAETILDSLGRDGARLVARGGLRLVTTLDLDLYYQSECVLRARLAQLRGDATPVAALDGSPCLSAAYLPIGQSSPGESPPDVGALVIIDAATGEIRSLVGAATAVAYQPGVTLQPFVYFEGFRSGLFSPGSMVLDIPRTFPGAAQGLIYTPANPDGRFRGPINLRDAMSAWLLPPAAQVARQQGLDNILRVAHRIGLNSLGEDGRFDLSLLERGGRVSVLDMTYAYSVFAALGDMRGAPVEPIGRGYRQRSPVAVLRIEDASGATLWEYSPEQVELNKVSVFPPGIGYLINDVLSDDTARQQTLGEGRTVLFSRPAAVVSGLAGDGVESWAVGYTPQIVTGVRLGRADGAPMTLDRLGLDGAATVWRAVMEYLHQRDNLPPSLWTRPEDTAEGPVCARSGLLPNAVCPARHEVYLTQFPPREVDTYWQAVEINSQTGQLATASTPAELRSQSVFFIPPPEAADWWRANNLPLPPTEYDTVSRPERFSSVQILQPAPFAYVGGVVDIRGTLDPTNMQYFQLAYGQGPNPSEWIQIGERQTEFRRGATLGQWNTAGLSGLYNILLTVVLNDNTRESRSVLVTVDNTPPAITLTAGEPGRVFRWPGDQTVPLTAEVQDDYSVARVEFYHNGQFLGADETWPYGFEWKITRTGIEQFAAAAYDVVGNRADAAITVTVERSGG